MLAYYNNETNTVKIEFYKDNEPARVD